jgi:putative membrane protein
MKKSLLLLLFISGYYLADAQIKKSERDERFVMDASQSGLLEIKLAELAKTNASSQDVKDLGATMVDVHTILNDDLTILATKKNMMIPTGLSSEGQKCYNSMSKKTGKEFDEAFTKSLAKEHKKTISQFQDEAVNGGDKDLKEWVSKTLPALQHHLQLSEELCKQNKKS